MSKVKFNFSKKINPKGNEEKGVPLLVTYPSGHRRFLRHLQDVLKRSRRLTINQDIVTMSYGVLKTSDLRRLEDVQFRAS